MNNQPIGFIDSGVGGLSVVKAVMNDLPNEDVLFIGDSARNPYGTRSKEEVLKFTRQLANFLQDKKIKALVLACNTATAAALPTLQKELDIPVIGVIEWGSKRAASHSSNKKIGVIGTKATINSGEYEKQLKNINDQYEIFNMASSKFVEIVEKNEFENESTNDVVAEELQELKPTEIDTLILGCTHYPLLKKYIQNYFGEDVFLVDPGIETSKELKSILENNQLINKDNSQKKNHVFYTTGDQKNFETIARKWLPNKNFKVESIEIGE